MIYVLQSIHNSSEKGNVRSINTVIAISNPQIRPLQHRPLIEHRARHPRRPHHSMNSVRPIFQNSEFDFDNFTLFCVYAGRLSLDALTTHWTYTVQLVPRRWPSLPWKEFALVFVLATRIHFGGLRKLYALGGSGRWQPTCLQEEEMVIQCGVPVDRLP